MILENRLPIIYILKKIKWDIPIITAFSTIIHFLSVQFSDHITVPISISAFLGTTIALLLSFKLSQSYDRWWEARKIWGAIVNDSRSLVIQLKNFTSNKNPKAVKAIAYRQIAWCYAFSRKLRKLEECENLDQYIATDELKKVSNFSNLPLAMMDLQSQEVGALHQSELINNFQHIQLDNTIVRLVASMGKAERIKNTVFPKTYRLTLQSLVYIFLVFLSFSLTDLHSLVEIPLLVVISIPFLLLQKIALTIQDPFENRPADTAMTSISRTIEINIKELLGEDNIPEPLKSDTFYIL